MNKTLRTLLVGVALVGAAAPALARGGGGDGGGNGGGGSDGGTSAAWDITIAQSARNRAVRTPGATVPEQRVRQTVELPREDTCGIYRGRVYCRPVR